MDFAENFNRICKLRNTSATAICKKLGLSTSKVNMWNNGSLPKQQVLLELAKTLECTVMDFFMDDETQYSFLDKSGQELDDDEKDIIRIFRTMDRRTKHEFMAMMYDHEKNVNY